MSDFPVFSFSYCLGKVCRVWEFPVCFVPVCRLSDCPKFSVHSLSAQGV